MKTCTYALLTVLMFTAPVFAGVTISSPAKGDHVSSPFTLSATSTQCSSESISSMAYAIDGGDPTTVTKNSSFDKTVSASAGTHTIHVIANGEKGAVCVADVQVTVSNVTDDVVADTSLIPGGATSVSGIQGLRSWGGQHDSRTSGHSSGSTKLIGAPSHGGATRQFAVTYKASGGERFSVSFGDNVSDTNFFYDAWVYIPGSSKIQNLEMDTNQVMANGQTVIYSFQCSAYSDRWEYGKNAGTPKHPSAKWTATAAKCSPSTWARNTWHHVQIMYSRNSSGTITYKAVWFDGAESTINKTVPGAFALGWAHLISTNFQIDGIGSGTATAYLGPLTIYHW